MGVCVFERLYTKISIAISLGRGIVGNFYFILSVFLYFLFQK